MTELATIGADSGVARWASVLVPAAQLAERIAGTEFVPKAMRGKPDVVTACIMYGDEIGVGPMQALAGIHVVEGRPYPSAELLRAMILRAGHSLVVHEMTGTRVRMSGLRHGAPESDRLVMEWTQDMARAAGLLSKDNWRKYPRAMLAARCTADIARLAFPDVVKGLSYLAEDVEDAAFFDAGLPAEPAPAKRTRKAVQRRSRPTTAPVDPDPVAPALEPRAVPYEPWGGDQPLPVRPLDPDAPPDAELEARVEAAPEPEPEAAPLEPPPEANPRPEPRADAPEPAPAKTLAPSLLRALHASLGRALGRQPGGDAETYRRDRLALVGAIVRRDVDTTTTLTRAEAMRCLDVLAAVASGQATWELNEDTGAIEVLDLREPPDDEEGAHDA